MARKYGKKASEKIERTLHEWKRGTLRSGSGGKVTSQKQAIAIGLSQARRAGGKVPPKQGHATKSLDSRVRTYLVGMRPGTEIDARGIARALGGGIDPLEADYALERAEKAGHAVTSDGRWFGPARGGSSHATRRKSPSQLNREINAALSGKSGRSVCGVKGCGCGCSHANKPQRAHATKRRVKESQEMKELRAERDRLFNALGYAGNTSEQVRAYHARLDAINAKMGTLAK